MICAARSELVVRAAQYAAALNPNAAFHIVSVIPTHRSRYPLTSLLTKTFEDVAREALHEVELALMERKVLAVKKAVIPGRPEEELLNYALRYGVDLITITSSSTESPPPRVVGSVARHVIAYSPIPLLVYTPKSPKPPEVIGRVSVLVEGRGELSVDSLIRIVDSIASPSLEVRLLCYHLGRYCIEFKEGVEGLNKVLSVDSIHVPGHSEVERLEHVIKAVEGDDLLIIGRGGRALTPKLLRRVCRLSLRENVLAAISPAPVLMV